jgi:hypothetical protein
MLLKTTQKCGRGCSHCMEASTPAGEHMEWSIFLRALELTKRVERLAWETGCMPIILLSGGECTEHPDIVKMIEEVIRQGLLPVLISNGMWLDNPKLKAAILRPEWPQLWVQVTYDSRFYPDPPPPRHDDPRLFYVPALSRLVTLGRAARKKNFDAKGLQPLAAPGSFNLRSATRNLGSFEKAVALQRQRAAQGKSGHCSPSISNNGDIVAGETNFCWKIGNVDSTNDELTKNVLAMGSCNRCGLEEGLSQLHRRALGLTNLYLGTEP